MPKFGAFIFTTGLFFPVVFSCLLVGKNLKKQNKKRGWVFMTFQIFFLTITVSKRNQKPEEILYNEDIDQRIKEMKYRQSIHFMF